MLLSLQTSGKKASGQYSDSGKGFAYSLVCILMDAPGPAQSSAKAAEISASLSLPYDNRTTNLTPFRTAVDNYAHCSCLSGFKVHGICGLPFSHNFDTQH